MVVVYRFLSRNRPVLLFRIGQIFTDIRIRGSPEPYLSCNELRYLVVISSLPIICRVIRCSSSSEVILSAISLTAAPASPAMPAFAPISSNCSATLVLQGAATAQPLATRLSALFSTTFFPAPAPAAAPATSPLAMPPAIPADSVASVLTVCF